MPSCLAATAHASHSLSAHLSLILFCLLSALPHLPPYMPAAFLAPASPAYCLAPYLPPQHCHACHTPPASWFLDFCLSSWFCLDLCLSTSCCKRCAIQSRLLLWPHSPVGWPMLSILCWRVYHHFLARLSYLLLPSPSTFAMLFMPVWARDATCLEYSFSPCSDAHGTCAFWTTPPVFLRHYTSDVPLAGHAWHGDNPSSVLPWLDSCMPIRLTH